MKTHFKTTRPSGFDTYSGTVRWAPADGAPVPHLGLLVSHPVTGGLDTVPEDEKTSPSRFLSASTRPADCAEMVWPCRLFAVKPVDDAEVWAPNPRRSMTWRASTRWRVVEELPSWMALGPNGQRVAELLDMVNSLESHWFDRLAGALSCHMWSGVEVARSAAWKKARDLARDHGRAAAWKLVTSAGWNAGRADATAAVHDILAAELMADKLTGDEYRVLAWPWLSIFESQERVAA